MLDLSEGTLAADATYRTALAATQAPPLRTVHLALLLQHGLAMIQTRREVEAARAYGEALELRDTMSQKGPLYGFTLVALAASNEKMGLPIEAEKLYRRALPLPPYPGKTFWFPSMFSTIGGEETHDWEDFELALTRFLARSRRFDEAEQIHKDRVARASGAEKASRLRDYILFLRAINRISETAPLYRQAIAINQLDSGKTGRDSLHSDLAAFIATEGAAGDAPTAESLLADQVQYDRQTSRPEYESDLHDYAESLLSSGHLELAGKVIDDEVSAADRRILATAMWHKVKWMRMTGNEEGARELDQRIAALPPAYDGVTDERETKERQLAADTLQLVEQGQFEKAHRSLDELWLLISPDDGNAQMILAQTMDEIAIAFAKMNRKQDSVDVLTRKLATTARWNGAESPEMFRQLIGAVCTSYSGLGMSKLAFDLLDRASALAVSLDGEESTQSEEISGARFSLFVRENDEAAASREADKLLNLSGRIHGPGSETTREEATETALELNLKIDLTAPGTPLPLNRLGCY